LGIRREDGADCWTTEQDFQHKFEDTLEPDKEPETKEQKNEHLTEMMNVTLNNIPQNTVRDKELFKQMSDVVAREIVPYFKSVFKHIKYQKKRTAEKVEKASPPFVLAHEFVAAVGNMVCSPSFIKLFCCYDVCLCEFQSRDEDTLEVEVARPWQITFGLCGEIRRGEHDPIFDGKDGKQALIHIENGIPLTQTQRTMNGERQLPELIRNLIALIEMSDDDHVVDILWGMCVQLLIKDILF
jgi:hypothetical protein